MSDEQEKNRIRILFVDDDPEIREVVSVLLECEGYQVILASDGQSALELIGEGFDLIILDVLMPGLSGFETCSLIREVNKAPILFLTAKSQTADKVMGLAVGGDDYLSKPFSSEELLAQVAAMLRRYREYGSQIVDPDEEVIQIGQLRIDAETHEVYVGPERVDLTELEFSLLLLLAQNHGRIVSARELYENVWNDLYLPKSSNTVMVHIRNLRRKLKDDPRNPTYVRTVWGKGYVID